jgi:purine-binding chemotaxis protein CheW
VTASRREEILRARAAELARAGAEQGEAQGETIEVVEFLIAEERYGFETVHVREVYPLRDLTPLPCVPRFYRGIVNMRGQMLPVLDLRTFFDLPDGGLSNLNRLIVVRVEDRELGVLADRVLGIRAVAVEQLEPALPTFTGVREQYLRGITADHLIVLDAARLLGDRSLIVNEEPED